MADIPNELDYSRKVADGERLELIMRQVASRFKLDGNVLAEALLDIHERLKAVEGATEGLTSSDRWKAFKTVQLAKPSPSASGDTVTAIDTVAQDENGEVTATKKNIRQGTTSQTGIVQLSDATDSTSTTLAATANAVKTAYDLAASKQDALGISSSGSATKFLNEQGEWATVTTPDVSGVTGVYSRLGGAWSKTSGDADITALTAGNYHYTIIAMYSVGTTSNTIATIDSVVGSVTHKAPVDCSYVHDGMVEFSGDFYGTALNPTLVFPTGVSLYPAAYLFVHSTAGGGGGSGDADIVVFKVSYSTGVADYVYPTYQEVANAVSAGKMPVILRYVHNSPVQHCFVFRWLSEDYIHFDNGSQYVEISNEDAVKTGYVNDKNLAADYDPTATYDIGEYCVYHNELFVCTTDILVAEEWNGSHWRRTSMSDIVGNVETLLAAL